ncbi:MAG: outer membrane lipoprotein-sorting protein [Bdellovibrionia bacterium]
MKHTTLALSLLFAAHAFAAESPDSIIKKVDDIRNPAESFFMKVEIHDVATPKSQYIYDVSLNGNTKTLVKTIEPAREQGRNFLMLEEDMWAFLPNLGRAVRVSLSQKLTGQAANGDISRMRWSGDYTPTIEKETPKEWVLFLTANKKGLTYEKVRVWVDKSNYHPTHAEFLAASGKPLKNAIYQGYKTMSGKVRPTQMIIQDANRTSDQSQITILNMTPKSFPASLFNPKSMEE